MVMDLLHKTIRNILKTIFWPLNYNFKNIFKIKWEILFLHSYKNILLFKLAECFKNNISRAFHKSV